MTKSRNAKLAWIGVFSALAALGIGRVLGLVGLPQQVLFAAVAALTAVLLGLMLLNPQGELKSRRMLALVIVVLFIAALLVVALIWSIVATSTDL